MGIDSTSISRALTRRSSSMSDGGGLFGSLEARGFAAEAVGDAAFLRAMLRFEGALADVQAQAGLIPADHARQIGEVCRGAAPDPGQLAIEAAATGTLVVPMLDALRSRLPPDVAASLHVGATSQDVIDTATMLTASGAIRMIVADLEDATAAARHLAGTHAETRMAGRTLLQQARPTTFGAKAAVWVDSLDASIVVLTHVRDERLAVQLGGPVGTLDDFDEPEQLVKAFAGQLCLPAPEAAWHTERSRIVELGSALGIAAASIAKVGLDIVLLAQTEVGEASDDDLARGGSSSMPGKRNPIAAVLARANAMRAGGLVAGIVIAASSGEHERAAGSWHAEWRTLRELIVAVGSAAAWLRDVFEHLSVDPDRMLRNLELAGLDAASRPIQAAAHIARRVAHRVPDATARPIRVLHVDEGRPEAPVVVLSNSLGSTLGMWDEVVGDLAADHRIVRYDLRGHGGSPTPPGPYTIDDLGADLLALLDRLGAERASLIGSSIGGMASLWVAANAPDRVDRLVVIGSASHLGPAQGWIDRSRSVLLDGTAGVAEAVTPRWVSPAFAAAHPEAMDRYRAMFAAADPAGYAGCCIAIARMDLTGALGRITSPTLIAVGSEDPATPQELSRTMADAIPGARLALIEGGAHLPSLDQPDLVAGLIREHVS
jgi:3-carboxy-cis,cis-muconate cycloisomerase